MEAVMDRAEIQRRKVALYDVLDRVLSLSEISGPQLDLWHHVAHGLASASVTGDPWELDFTGLNRKREQEKLREVHTLARKLAKAVGGLHWRTKIKLQLESSDILAPDQELSERDREDFWKSFWEAVYTLDRVVDKIVPAISADISAAPELGRRRWLNIAIVESLRDLWEDRKKTPAPMNITDSGPFTDFIIEAFEALGLKGNPRATMDSWREYRAKHPRND
jgi:hypothetical protein